MIVSVGIPLDENSSFLKGAALAPQKIRMAFHSESTNTCAENGVDTYKDLPWRDMGDIDISGMPQALVEIETAIEHHVKQDRRVICLGGDHSITYPVVKGFAKRYPDLNILHIDAHADLYDQYKGNKYSHASPFARIMEEGLAKKLIQVGIRTLTRHQREQARKFNVGIIEMKAWDDNLRFDFSGPVYISIDLDALDPAFAPGVSHYEPGGFTTRQLIRIIQNIEADVVGCDIVEFNPYRDVHDLTAMVAVKLFKELLVKLSG